MKVRTRRNEKEERDRKSWLLKGKKKKDETGKCSRRKRLYRCKMERINRMKVKRERRGRGKLM